MAPKYTVSQLGRCATCKYMELCTSRANWMGPVLHCEEYDRREKAADAEVEIRAPKVAKPIDFGVKPEAAIYKGICSNCDVRESCGYRISGHVVWHCEEYRLEPLPKLIPETLLPPFGMKHPAIVKADAREPRSELEADDIKAILIRHDLGPGELIKILEEIQGIAGYLPEKAIRQVSETTGRSMVDLYGIATFYRSFSLKPRGRHTISVCQGTACHVRGAPSIMDEFERQLEVKPGETTADGSFTLETVNCLGACALGPIVVGGDQYFSNVESAKVRGILRKIHSESHAADVKTDPRFFPIALRCSLCGRSLMDRTHFIDGHPSVRLAATHGGEQGTIWFSSLYGSYAVNYEHDIPVDAVASFSCPHCGGELKGDASCPECDSPMAPMLAEGGGMVQICTKRGCKGHTLDLTFDYF